MLCPNCGFDQPESFECIHCGIVFAKFEERKKRISDENLKKTKEYIPIPQRRIGNVSWAVRIGVTILCLLIAILMLLNGIAFKTFESFIVLLLYATGSLYLIVSFFEKITIKRFAIETLVLVFGSLFLYIIFPSIFSLEKPIFRSTVPRGTDPNLIKFVELSKLWTENSIKFLNTSDLPNEDEFYKIKESLSISPLKTKFISIKPDEQQKVFDVWAEINNLYHVFEVFLTKQQKVGTDGPDKWIPEEIKKTIFQTLNNIKQRIIQIELEIQKEQKKIEEKVRSL